MLKKLILAFSILINVLNAFSKDVIKENEWILQIKSHAQIRKISESIGFKIVNCISSKYCLYLVSFEETNTQKILNKLHSQVDIIKFQRNFQIKYRNTTPNDIDFTKQWYLSNSNHSIGATEVWDYTTGGITQSNDTIVVGVIEYGMDINHPDLYNNIYHNSLEIPYNQIDDDSNGYIDDYHGYNVELNNDSIYLSSHGSMVAGIIGATGNNSTGISGINWRVKILPISIQNLDEATLLSAYSYLAQLKYDYLNSNGKKGAFIVASNSSFGIDQGDPNDHPIWCSMYDSLGVLGILNVASTANLGLNMDVTNDMPSGCVSHFLITSTNYDDNGDWNTSSGYGKRNVDIAAPGSDIYSTQNNSSYGTLSGTSFATPMVTGSTALLSSAICSSINDWFKLYPSQYSLFLKSLLLNYAKQDKIWENLTQSGGKLSVVNSFNHLNSGNCTNDSIPFSSIYITNRQNCENELTKLIAIKMPYRDSINWLVNNQYVNSNDTLDFKSNIPGYYNIKLLTFYKNLIDTTELIQGIRVLKSPAKPVIISLNNISLTTSTNAIVNWYDSTGKFLSNSSVYNPQYYGKYTCSYINFEGCISYSDTFFFGNNIISQHTVNQNIKINPNPFNQLIQIEIGNELISKVNFFDLNGKKLTEIPMVSNTNGIVTYNTSFLALGFYICELISVENQIFRYKILKIN